MFAMVLILVSASGAFLFGQRDEISGPTFKDVLSLKSVRNPSISPDGKFILFTIRQADWEKNDYDTEIWLCRCGEVPFQLTRTPDGGSTSPAWSSDSRWISFLSSRDKGRQIYLISPIGGEAFRLTDHEEDIYSYQWSPEGNHIAFSAAESHSKEEEATEKQYGRFAVEDAQYRISHLWLIEVTPNRTTEPERLTSGKEFTVGNFQWSPDGTKIAFDHRPDALINSYPKTDISILDVATGEIVPLVTQPGTDAGPRWSPDGRLIQFSTKKGDHRYYTNSELALIPASGGDIKIVTGSFDENPYALSWNSDGIYFLASEKVHRRLFRLNPETGEIQRIEAPLENVSELSFDRGGRSAAVSGSSRTTLTEIYHMNLDTFELEPVTKITDQVKDWKTGTREVIQWRSADGIEIEGVLWKPEGFAEGKKYPLLVIIHGGPSSISRPVLVSGGVYPFLQWLEKGALILQPNYRGSAGYGEEFRSLNVRNLGVGDMWDVESGVEHLIDLGMVEPERVGAMGWSQGGYISAFLTTNSAKFKAISVGAGISNWITYYVNTDIHPFTLHYLGATPWDDMDIYLKTSPMTNIRRARTPTLIQHGEFDQRVPIPNAYELYQGLQDMGVETRLIVYKDFGHGISRPKEQLAAQWHNWQWFARYIWDEKVELPLEFEK
jgi:dipeptidyl aminopeptidase/acylaminoacyl peptidase